MSLLKPQELWERTVATTRSALASGALQPIATDCREVEQQGVAFQVRMLGRVHLKEKRVAPRPGPFNPFEHPDPELTVGELSPTHLCLLNKFNVVEHHLLIVTRAFEEQESLLTAADFEALALGLEGLDGLGFYNSGEQAGASLRHKHLQLIAPLGPGGLRAPMEALLTPRLVRGEVTAVPTLGFLHALTGLGLHGLSPTEAGAQLLAAYRALLAALGLERHVTPYNLLATRDWMLLVPRACAATLGINVNAMGFSGSLLVKTPEQLEHVKSHGPLSVLRQVTMPLP